MTPKSASELSLVEAIPLPALDPNPKQSGVAIVGTGRVRLPELRAETATAVLQLIYPETATAEWLFPQEKATLYNIGESTRIGEPL